MNVYPFFIECSKYYSDPHKQKFLRQLAFGKGGGLIINRKDKNILITSDGEFVIPLFYSDEARLELEKKLWKCDDFEKMQEDIKNMRTLWSTTKKKDKLFLFYKYIASLDFSMNEKIVLCNLITLTLLLKIIKPTDVVYKNYVIEHVNEDLFKNEKIKNIEFSYDYSIPLKTKKTTIETIEEDDE